MSSAVHAHASVRTVGRWGRRAVAPVVLALVVWRLGTGPFLAGLKGVDARAVLAAAAVVLVTTVCAAWRWTIVARGLGIRLSLPAAIAAYYRAVFLNLTLPGGVAERRRVGPARGSDGMGVLSGRPDRRSGRCHGRGLWNPGTRRQPTRLRGAGCRAAAPPACAEAARVPFQRSNRWLTAPAPSGCPLAGQRLASGRPVPTVAAHDLQDREPLTHRRRRSRRLGLSLRRRALAGMGTDGARMPDPRWDRVLGWRPRGPAREGDPRIDPRAQPGDNRRGPAEPNGLRRADGHLRGRG